MRIVFLGTGNAFSTRDRSNVGVLLPENGILLDCPPDVLYKLKRISYRPERLRYVILSHLHGDHFLGAPFLLIYSRFQEEIRLRFLARRGAGVLIRQVTSQVYPEIGEEWLSQVEVVEIGEGEYSFEEFKLRVQETEHVIPNYSFRLEVEPKVITYSGDTGTDISELAENSDLLIHEASARKDGSKIHSSLREALDVFITSRSKRLALVHVYAGIEDEVKRLSLDRVTLPSDLESLEI